MCPRRQDPSGSASGTQGQYHGNFQSARSSALLLKLIDELFKAPSITIGKARPLSLR